MKKKALSILIITLCLFSAFSISYGIDNYNVQFVVGKDAVHYVTEDIAMNFYTPGHGFFREIPYLFEGSPVRARIKDVECSAPYEAEYSDGYYSMKIGDADRTVVGVQDYRIQYSYDLGQDYNEGYDEVYIDLLGNAWECPTENFSFAVYFPKKGLSLNDFSAWVTTGSYGSNKQVSYDLGETELYYVILGQVKNLRAGQAVTLRLELPDGWFVDARPMWDARPVMSIVAPYLSIILVLIAALLWKKYGKDKTPIITARYEAPEGFSPMVIGFLADGSVDDKDITSMIFNWADRGLLTINEKKKDKFTFTKLNDIEATAPAAEVKLFNAFFRGCQIGKEQTLERLRMNNFAESMLQAKVTVGKYFTKDKKLHSGKARALAVLTGFATVVPLILMSCAITLCEFCLGDFAACLVISFVATLLMILNMFLVFRKWYIRKSNVCSFMLTLILPAILLFGSYVISLTWIIPLICIASSYVLSIFTIIIDKRTEYGQKMFEEVLGYREFIDKVSMDELKLMIDKDPEIYYKVLSYAIVLGLENKWAKKFEGLSIPQPSWYTGSNVVDMMYYSHLASRMRTAVVTNSIPQTAGKAVGGTGFHSTGFAGGGFGGGGGHAW